MKLHRLELEGFGPFRERQTVDFDAYADDGIFLIAGRTGAGKSSVLDGVCFALYGSAPRYDGADRRLRSDHCAPEDPTSVTLEFSAAGGRWRLTRSPEYERPKLRGTGMTTEPHRAELLEEVDGRWIGRAARPVDVAHAVDELLGLNQQQFLQVILLAQNRFAEFLLARSDDRQKLLRRLFGTRTYEDYQSALDQRRKDAEAAVSSGGELVELLLGEAEKVLREHALEGEAAEGRRSVAERLEDLRRGLQRADYRVETLAREADDADAAHREAQASFAAAKELREAQERRTRSRVALARLEADAPRIAAGRLELERALAAEAVRAPIETARRAAEALASALRAEEAARTGWLAHDAAGETDAASLRARIARLTGDLAVWAGAAETERALAPLEAALARDAAGIEEQAAVVAELDAARAQLPDALAALDAQLAPAREAAGSVGAARERLAGIELRLDAAREAEELAEALRAADADRLDAVEAHDHARSAVTQLLRRRLAGHAAELAAGLVEGEPCAVCGATAHPHPAEPVDEPVTDDLLAAVERARDRAAGIETEAAELARAAREAHAAASARAGGGAVAELTIARKQADALLRDVEAAVVLCDRLAAERVELVAMDAAAAAEREELAAALAAAREALAAKSAEAEAARAAVSSARGGFATVAERIAAAATLRDAAGALTDALDRTATARVQDAEARADRDARVAASMFTGDKTAGPDDAVIAATAALRDAATRARLDEDIRAHDAALRAERDRLRELELELAGVPDEHIDVAAAAAALETARSRWSAAAQAMLRTEQLAARVRDLLSRAEAEHAGIEVLAAEASVIARLANAVAGRPPNTLRMTLEAFVLAAELEEIVEAANLRLSEMSAGRYLIQHTDARAARNAASGLGLEIFDSFTGMPRPAQSLSGGETFLASLALALGLAEVVTSRAGGVRLDTLFIDEGFGSLDGDTLELAMRTLDELRQGGRTVGVISHVEAMKEQLPAQLVVEATPRGPSVVRAQVVSAGALA
ncbi:SMC family ATPase [Microbacterium sp. BK668]|uniref:AAA family ATPase n=1 Tax=Microbacterium sp. BK668 TaxID=2512118 RepID=UPI001060E8CF|nr:SMC family ATPase [Microbacterium sp. BK668]TDN91840.1 exonuclease SbcC [Microbacterium sp. BK668]